MYNMVRKLAVNTSFIDILYNVLNAITIKYRHTYVDRYSIFFMIHSVKTVSVRFQQFVPD